MDDSIEKNDFMDADKQGMIEAMERLASSEKTLHYALSVQILVCIVGLGVVFSVLPRLSVTPADVLKQVRIVEHKLDNLAERDSAITALSEAIRHPRAQVK